MSNRQEEKKERRKEGKGEENKDMVALYDEKQVGSIVDVLNG